MNLDFKNVRKTSKQEEKTVLCNDTWEYIDFAHYFK